MKKIFLLLSIILLIGFISGCDESNPQNQTGVLDTGFATSTDEQNNISTDSFDTHDTQQQPDTDTSTQGNTDSENRDSETGSDTNETGSTDTATDTGTGSEEIDTSPVGTHGQLKVNGNQIVGKLGNPVLLKGMSLYWSVWGPQKYYNENVVKWLVDDWKINLIRTAMAVDINDRGEEDKGWIYHKDRQTALVETVVDAAIENGIYIIVDWHTHNIHTNEAKEFFEYMAQKYGNTPNLIWEIFNEPIRQSWPEIKTYSEEVINVIRQYSDNLILAGTRNWSQRVDEASENPLSDANTAYVLHFYAGTHGQELRDTAQSALDNGVALFISEWGTSSADGGREDRNVYTNESREWIQWAVQRNISMANWSLGDIDESSASLTPGASVNGGWDLQTDLTESGRFIREQIININTQ
jgi:endoglucanase